MNRINLRALALRGLVPGLIATALPAHAAEFCVASLPDLQAALNTAASNGEADTINVEFGEYLGGGLTYSSSEPFPTHLKGGFGPGCTFDATAFGAPARELTIFRTNPGETFLTYAATQVPTTFSGFTLYYGEVQFLAESNVALSDVLITSDDTDGDGVPDHADAFPNNPTETADTDGDGVGDNTDAFPTDPTETVDTDGDGIGDNADPYVNAVTRTTALGTAAGVSVSVQPADAASVVMLQSALTEDATAACADAGAGVYPHMVSFVITGAVPGEVFPVEVDFGEALAPDMLPHKLLGDGTCMPIAGATVSGSVVAYDLEDNGPYDSDPTPGSLNDPLVLVMPAAVAPESAVVPLPMWALGVLSLALTGGVMRRRCPMQRRRLASGSD